MSATKSTPTPWPKDAPKGKCWRCPECGFRTTLGMHAGYHAVRKDHKPAKLISTESANPPSDKETSILLVIPEHEWIAGRDLVKFYTVKTGRFMSYAGFYIAASKLVQRGWLEQDDSVNSEGRKVRYFHLSRTGVLCRQKILQIQDLQDEIMTLTNA